MHCFAPVASQINTRPTFQRIDREWVDPLSDWVQRCAVQYSVKCAVEYSVVSTLISILLGDIRTKAKKGPCVECSVYMQYTL